MANVRCIRQQLTVLTIALTTSEFLNFNEAWVLCPSHNTGEVDNGVLLKHTVDGRTLKIQHRKIVQSISALKNNLSA